MLIWSHSESLQPFWKLDAAILKASTSDVQFNDQALVSIYSIISCLLSATSLRSNEQHSPQRSSV